jgi:hypothetical protein
LLPNCFQSRNTTQRALSSTRLGVFSIMWQVVRHFSQTSYDIADRPRPLRLEPVNYLLSLGSRQVCVTMLDLRSMGNSPLACSLPACGRALSLSSEPVPCCQRPGVPGDQACVGGPVSRRSLCKLYCFGRIATVTLMTLRGQTRERRTARFVE